MDDKEEFALKMMTAAKGYVGEDRAHNPHQISKFLAIFGLPFVEGDEFVPYCAAGVSYSAAKALAELKNIPLQDATSVQTLQQLLPEVDSEHFKPSASCHVILQDAEKRGIWMSKEQTLATIVKPGWLVLYDFAGNGVADHIEIVESAATELHTVGFNTATENNFNGGAVAERTRSYTPVLGYVRLY